MSKRLLIIFVKNPILGKVKTRLAKAIGNKAAVDVYKKLLNHTKKITRKLDFDKVVYYSNFIDREDTWDENTYDKQLQKGVSLGEKMHDAFSHGFENAYDQICIIGSDCFEIKEEIISSAFDQLIDNDIVIGPAKDGGYYLLGMKKMHKNLFENMPWSTSKVLEKTISEAKKNTLKHTLLPILNDVDTEDDLNHSKL